MSILKIGPAWATPAERQQWERRLDARLDAQQRRKRNGEGPPDKGTFAKVGSRVYRNRKLNGTVGRYIALIAGYCAGKGSSFTDEWQPHIADELGVTTRTIRRVQKVAQEWEMIQCITHKGRRRKNRYIVLPAALPAPLPARKRKSDKNVRSTPTDLKPTVLDRSSPPDPLPASGKGGSDGAPGRRAEAMGALDGRPAARAIPSTGPTVDASHAPPLAPPRPARTTAARQGASSIGIRAPP